MDEKNVEQLPGGNFSSSALVRYLRNEINSGRYRPGEKVESVRSLAARLGVGRQIVLFALGQLVKHGLLESSPRRGYFISREFRPNRFYRIGLLVHDINPLRSYLYTPLYFAALYYGYQMILLNNFEYEFAADDLLKNVHDLDGVIITGRRITDRMLEPFAAGSMPYVVLGKYDISPRHHSEWLENNGKSIKSLSNFIRKNAYKKVTVVVGPVKSFSDRNRATGFQDFLAAHNPECRIETVFAQDNGYHECRNILSGTDVPQLLVFVGEHILGYCKYVEAYPDSYRPAVAISQHWEIAAPPELVDFVIPSPAPEEYRKLMEKLLKRLNCL